MFQTSGSDFEASGLAQSENLGLLGFYHIEMGSSTTYGDSPRQLCSRPGVCAKALSAQPHLRRITNCESKCAFCRQGVYIICMFETYEEVLSINPNIQPH